MILSILLMFLNYLIRFWKNLWAKIDRIRPFQYIPIFFRIGLGEPHAVMVKLLSRDFFRKTL